MIGINNVNSPALSSAGQATGSTGQQQGAGGFENLGKSEFLKLLVAQLEHQDPLDPVNNDQFVNQLATFSSLEQLIGINKGVTKLAGTDVDSTTQSSGPNPE